MFVDSLSKQGDEWIVVNPSTGDSLSNVLCDNYDGIVITGSHYNVRDQLQWYDELCDIIRNIAECGTPSLYGGCFGHQLIAHALGGTAGKNEKFVMKAEQIHFLPSAKQFFMTCLTSLNLLEVHGDCVLSLPPNSQLLAYSDSCPHEVFIAGSKRNILCCQAHPEFDVQYCFYEKIWPLCQSRLADDEEIETSKASLETYTDDDAKKFLQLINGFLRRNLAAP